MSALLSVLVDVISRTPSTPFICSSIRSTTELSISCGAAPGYVTETPTTGVSTVGVSWRGIMNIAMMPKSTTRMTPTTTGTACRMQKAMMFIEPPLPRPWRP